MGKDETALDEDNLLEALWDVDEDELREIVDGLPHGVLAGLLSSLEGQTGSAVPIPASPMEQALEIEDNYRARSHLDYLSDRLTKAVEDVENGISRFIRVSMPPRMGKSHLTSIFFPLWLLRRHPDWKLGLISHTDSLSIGWGREVRRIIEDNQDAYNIRLARDSGAASNWQTTDGGSIVSRSVGQSVTGLGFKVLLVDDAVRDFTAAHSATQRENLWNWWTANARTRLEPPNLVVMIGTRWHQDDLLGRLVSEDHAGDPDQWETISFPAIAEEDDVLGRHPGEPLISPLIEESRAEAIVRWDEQKRAVGSYSWSALYQQRPAPAKGAIFDVSWWRYWTTDPSKADGETIIYVDPDKLKSAHWIDSWDTSFGASDSSQTGSYVVGQRWARVGGDRLLVAQQRGRWSFTDTIDHMKIWSRADDPYLSPYGHLVHQRLIEAAATGPAIIDVLKREVSGLKPIKPRTSKESRARAITPEIESGNVLLPLPSDDNEWVTAELLPELRSFPHDANDDQVDALTQALSELRDTGGGSIYVPGKGTGRTKPSIASRQITRNYGKGARSTAGRRL